MGAQFWTAIAPVGSTFLGVATNWSDSGPELSDEDKEDDEIPFKAVGGVYGSWIGLLIIFLVLVAQFWTAIAPVGGNSEEGAAYDFFYAYLALPVVLAFWAAGYFWKKQGWLRTHQIDVDSGRREHDWERINAWKAELASMPAWKRLLHAIF